MYFCSGHIDIPVTWNGKGCTECMKTRAEWLARRDKKRQDRKDRRAAIELAIARGER